MNPGAGVASIGTAVPGPGVAIVPYPGVCAASYGAARTASVFPLSYPDDEDTLPKPRCDTGRSNAEVTLDDAACPSPPKRGAGPSEPKLLRVPMLVERAW